MAYANSSRAPLGAWRGLGASAPPLGSIVTVGGTLERAGGGAAVVADDTGQRWGIPAGSVSHVPASITRGVVRGTMTSPFVLGSVDGFGTYNAGERGTTVIAAPVVTVALGYTLPNGSTRPSRQFDLYYPGSPGNPNANPPIRAGGDPDQIQYLNRAVLPAFMADMQARLAAGEITTAYAQTVAQRALDLGWKPPPGLEDAFWLPVGGGEVPLALQGVVTDTGQILPGALTPEAQARMAEVLAYTAKMRGTSYEVEAARAADAIRALNPGETFPGVEKFLKAMAAGEPVELTAQEQTNTYFTVDERPEREQLLDPFGTTGAGHAGRDPGPALAAPGLGNDLLKWLLIGGGLGLLAFMAGSSGRR